MSALATFRSLRKKLAPSWLNTGEGELVGYSIDLILDAFLTRVFLGLMIGYPQWGPNGETAPDDALQKMGVDRRIIRGIDETSASYALRLRQFLTDWRTAGSAYTMMKQLAAYCDSAGLHGCSFRTVDNSGNWYSRSSAGVETASLAQSNWDWDGYTSKWSRFWVVIYPGTLWSAEGQWDGGTWDEPSLVWGSTAQQDHAASLLHIVSEWKPQGTRGNIILAFDANSFDPSTPEPDGTWGKHYKYSGGDAVESRLTTARYFGA